MTSRTRVMLRVFGLAVPVEIVNFFFCMVPLDVGISSDAPWYAKLLGSQWVLLHFPGLRLTSQFDPFDRFHLDWLVWFASGYIDTVVVMLACILLFKRFRQFSRRHPKQAL